MSSYGYCPHCGAEVTPRDPRRDGDDTCTAGHVYPSAYTLPSILLRDYVAMMRATLDIVRESLLDRTGLPMDGPRRGQLAARCRRTMHAIPRRTAAPTKPGA